MQSIFCAGFLFILLLDYDSLIDNLKYPWLKYILIAYPSLNCSLLIKKSRINIKSKLIDSKGFQFEFEDQSLKNANIESNKNVKLMHNDIPSNY